MRERSLVAFTVLSQLAVGLVWALLLVDAVGLLTTTGPAAAGGSPAWSGSRPGQVFAGPEAALAVVGIMVVAAAAALLHLGSPRNAWRALGNVRTSWLSREILFAGLFTAAVAAAAVAGWSAAGALGPLALGIAAAAGAGLILAMSHVYRLRTVPAWDSRLTTASFFLSALSLGSLATVFVRAWHHAAAGLSPTTPAGLATGGSAGLVGPGGEVAATALLLSIAFAALAVELWLEPLWAAHRRTAREAVDAGLFPSPPVGIPGAGPATRAALLTAALAGTVIAWVALGARAAGDAVPSPFLPAALALALLAALGATIMDRGAFYRSHARLGL